MNLDPHIIDWLGVGSASSIVESQYGKVTPGYFSRRAFSNLEKKQVGEIRNVEDIQSNMF